MPFTRSFYDLRPFSKISEEMDVGTKTILDGMVEFGNGITEGLYSRFFCF